MKKNISTTLLSLVLLLSSMSACTPNNNTNESKNNADTKEEAKKLNTPANVTLTGKVVSWNAVSDAKEYVVIVGTTEYRVNTNSFDLSNYDVADGTTIKVKAVADNYKDSEVSLSVKYEVSKSDTRVEYVKNALSETLGVDFTNPTELLKYQEPLAAMAQMMSTYNVNEQEIAKIVTFAESAMTALSQMEVSSPTDVVNLVMGLANEFVTADIDSKLLLGLVKDIVSMGIIKFADETYAYNNGYGIKAKKVASYLAKMSDADVAKIAKLLDYFEGAYKQAVARISSLEPTEDIGLMLVTIKDIIVDALTDNKPQYVEAKQIGEAIYNVLAPLDTEDKPLKRVIEVLCANSYQVYDYSLFAASKIDLEFVSACLEDVSGIAEVVMGLTSYTNPVHFVLDYSGVGEIYAEDLEKYDEIKTGLTNLFYNFEDIMFAHEGGITQTKLDDFYQIDLNLNSEFEEMLQIGLVGFIQTVLQNSGLNLEALSGLANVTGENAYEILTSLYEGLQLDDFIPFAEGKDMYDLLEVLARDVSMTKIAALQSCESVYDVIQVLALDTIFEFDENTTENFMHWVGDDFVAFVGGLTELLNSEEVEPASVAAYVLEGLGVQEAFISNFSPAMGFLHENFAVGYYPQIIAGLVEHAMQDVSTLQACFTDLASLVSTKIEEIETTYVPVDVGELPEVTQEDIAAISEQFSRLGMTDRQLVIVDDLSLILKGIGSNFVEGSYKAEQIAEKVFEFASQFEGKTYDEIFHIIVNDGEGDILPQVEDILVDVIAYGQEIADEFARATTETVLEKVKTDILAYINYDLNDPEYAAVVEEELDTMINDYLGVLAMIDSQNPYELAGQVCAVLDQYRVQLDETTRATARIQMDIRYEINSFVSQYTEEDNPIIDLMSIELPENVESLDSLYDFLVAYNDETFKAAFKTWVGDNYFDVVALLAEIADLNDDAVELLDKYYFYEVYQVEEISDGDEIYKEIVGVEYVPFASTLEENLLIIVDELNQNYTFEEAYSYIDMAIQMLQYQIFPVEEPEVQDI